MDTEHRPTDLGLPDLDAIVADVGGRALGDCGFDRLRWQIRPSVPEDLNDLLDIERLSFDAFDRPTARQRDELYAGPNGAVYGIGRMLKMVASRDGEVRGYAFVQWRPQVDAYILEMALRRLPPWEHGPSVGGVLLHATALFAVAQRLPWVSANIRRSNHRTPAENYRSDTLVRHCRLHGLDETNDRGLLSTGQAADPQDAWLRARPHHLLAHLTRLYLRRRERRPVPHAGLTDLSHATHRSMK